MYWYCFLGKIFLAEPPRSRFFRCWSRLRAVFMPGAGAGAAGRSRSRREPEPPKQGGSATLVQSSFHSLLFEPISAQEIFYLGFLSTFGIICVLENKNAGLEQNFDYSIFNQDIEKIVNLNFSMPKFSFLSYHKE